ncbi:hypothetical protein EXIGLDRAFT_726049 [Exidia glandulosa HHB12029]|uniref:EH domain-containing protein n=1 Tax=Exidia glandulosa HHB12029 TaxID=1314781 RepID=A0A165DWR1_EXIGL|nr:hypothetical protein EXIGLDRAFT_726049 [Exidia glandulosa HHB12029]
MTSIAARIAAFERGEPIIPPDSPPSQTNSPLPTVPVIPPTPRAGSPASVNSRASSSAPGIRAKAPPLPPRKPSLASLRSAASPDLTNAPPLPSRSVSDSLSVQHTYPPVKKGKHAHAASASSFQSVSLSSDGGDQDDRDHDSLDGSFESVPSSVPTSTSIPSSPASETLSLSSASKGPRLPPRPMPRASPSLSASSLPGSPSVSLPSSPPLSAQDRPVVSRRPAPPPPIKTPKFGESRPTSATAYPPMHSKNGGLSSVAAKRPTPVPPAARARYEALFDRNISAQRNAAKAQGLRPPRRADGWRGLSIDWTDDDSIKAEAAAEERLRGSVVKVIWSWSKLSREKLKQIWDEVNSDHHDGLTREQFARGTWRIDEELGKAAARKSARGTGSVRKAAPPLPMRKVTR